MDPKIVNGKKSLFIYLLHPGLMLELDYVWMNYNVCPEGGTVETVIIINVLQYHSAETKSVLIIIMIIIIIIITIPQSTSFNSFQMLTSLKLGDQS